MNLPDHGSIVKVQVFAKKSYLLSDCTKVTLVKEIQENAQKLLNDQVEYISTVHQKSAELGVNLMWAELREGGPRFEVKETKLSEE